MHLFPQSLRPLGRPKRSVIRPVFLNCVTLIVILTLCLYGLGLVGLYLRWFVLDAPRTIPTPVIVTVVLTPEPGTVEPVIITVVVTPEVPAGTPTTTLEPTPTQSWPAPAPEDALATPYPMSSPPPLGTLTP